MEVLFYSVVAACVSTLIGIHMINSSRFKIKQIKEEAIRAKEQFHQDLNKQVFLQQKIEAVLAEVIEAQKEVISLREDLNKCLIANGFFNSNRKGK